MSSVRSLSWPSRSSIRAPASRSDGLEGPDPRVAVGDLAAQAVDLRGRRLGRPGTLLALDAILVEQLL